MDGAVRAQPQPGEHARLETLRRHPTVEQREALLPEPPERHQGAQISRRRAVAQRLARRVLLLAAIDQAEAITLVHTQAAQGFAGAHRRQIEQNDVIRRQRRERGPLGVPLVFDTDNRGRRRTKDSDAWHGGHGKENRIMAM